MAELNGSNRAIKITKQDAVIQNNKKLKVAIYARVSSDRDTAFHSLEAQKDYFVRMVKGNDKYELCGVYADEAISGTTKDRPEFLRLIRDARDGLIDMIVTKSITRFARNTVMLLETVRELRELNVDVFFEKENLHSNSPDGELLITLLAMYAEEEARSASQNQRWRIKKKFSRD